MRRFALLITVLLAACTPSGGEQQPVTTLEGQPVALEDYMQGRPVILNFWASWCSFCAEEMPLLEAVYRDEPGIRVVAVNLQEEQAVARAYVEAGGYTFDVLLDPGSQLKEEFSVFTQPTTIVFDAEGNQLARKDGPFTEEELQEWVESLDSAGSVLPADEPAEQETDVEVSPPTPVLAAWHPDQVRHRIPLDAVMPTEVAPDEIPSIDNPQFVEASLATPDLDDLQGVFLQVEGDARFYPFAILNWHEIVNDAVGGTPVAVTYCPLCASAVVYERQTSAGTDTFGVTGLLYESNLLMYDRRTRSFWNQITGEAVVGPLTGEELSRVKSDILTLGSVKEFWPEAKVLSTITGHVRQYDLDPYEGYDQMEETLFPVSTVDERAVSKKLVYGVVVNGVPKAYTLDAIRDEGRIQDTFAGVAVLVQYDDSTGRVRFTRFFPGDEDRREELLPVRTFWFAWVAQYPETMLYE